MKKNPQWIAARRAVLNNHYGINPKPQTFYISSACYSDKTKFLLEGVAKRFTKRPPWEESFFELADDDSMMDLIKNITKSDGFIYPSDDIAIRFSPSYINEFYWAIGPIDNYKVCKLQMEETKMEAKKCERCGKLYETKDAADCVRTYLPGLPVSDYDKENFTESRIKRDHSTAICIVKKPGDEVTDLCPECREKLKNFFESGMNETNVIKKAEE